MSAEPNHIHYTFELGEDRVRFDISLESQPDATEAIGAPAWTELSCNQCSCCPLKPEKHSHCPAALHVHKSLKRFENSASTERIRLRVETERRIFEQECDLQSAINSMLGLQMATSGCPILGKLRGMATFHMPFSSFAETLYRSVGAYLIKQYYVKQDGKEPDWELQGLQQFYMDLERLNEAFSARIRDIDRNDAISNAVVMFFATSIVVANALEEGLVEFKDYFTGESVTPPKG
ncbi:MAG: DUF6901 family protein [Coraliomargarita sp.]